MKLSNQLNLVELKMFGEIFGILEKYKNQIRTFCITEKHSHFEMHTGEVFYETNDPNNRIMTVVPKPFKLIPKNAIETAWVRANEKIIPSQYCCELEDDDEVRPAGRATLTGFEIQVLNQVFRIMDMYEHLLTRSFQMNHLHTHFIVNKNEVLVETNDIEKRELIIVPEMPRNFTSMPQATAWRRGALKGALAIVANQFCFKSVA